MNHSCDRGGRVELTLSAARGAGFRSRSLAAWRSAFSTISIRSEGRSAEEFRDLADFRPDAGPLHISQHEPPSFVNEQALQFQAMGFDDTRSWCCSTLSSMW